MANENKDLKFIKKHYGEKLMHLCREMFPTILEQEGLLSEALVKTFAPTRSLYDDVESEIEKDKFASLIFSKVNVEPKVITTTKKTPEELFDEAGYILYPECQTEEEVQSFRKYYGQGVEELCTFRDKRLNHCRVWFAVKKDVDNIKRKDFKKPQREDLYGTSVLSIQFTRGQKSLISIKNRYNHALDNNPDATFENNLDNIIDGLTYAFTKKYGIELITGSDKGLNTYVLGIDGRYYRRNLEINACYCCENNYYISHGDVKQFNPQTSILMEQYLLDLEHKTICPVVDSLKNKRDAFCESVGEIKKVSIEPTETGRKVIVTPEEGEEVLIELNKHSEIIGYKNPNVKVVGNNFLFYNKKLEWISLPNVETMGNNSLHYNLLLHTIDAPQVKMIGTGCLAYNERLRGINMPQVKTIGNDFLGYNVKLREINMPQVKTIGNGFLYANEALREIYMPQLEEMGESCLYSNQELQEIYMPQLEELGDGFLESHKKRGAIIRQIKKQKKAYKKQHKDNDDDFEK